MEAYDLPDADGRGPRGVRATRAARANDLILVECPLVLLAVAVDLGAEMPSALITDSMLRLVLQCLRKSITPERLHALFPVVHTAPTTVDTDRARQIAALRELYPAHTAAELEQMAATCKLYYHNVSAMLTTTIYGVALYTLGSLLNHSCAPNAKVVMSVDGRFVLLAGAPIAPGEEVTISYSHLSQSGDAESPFAERALRHKHEHLRVQFGGHDCCCGTHSCVTRQIAQLDTVVPHSSPLPPLPPTPQLMPESVLDHLNPVLCVISSVLQFSACDTSVATRDGPALIEALDELFRLVSYCTEKLDSLSQFDVCALLDYMQTTFIWFAHSESPDVTNMIEGRTARLFVDMYRRVRNHGDNVTRSRRQAAVRVSLELHRHSTGNAVRMIEVDTVQDELSREAADCGWDKDVMYRHALLSQLLSEKINGPHPCRERILQWCR